MFQIVPDSQPCVKCIISRIFIEYRSYWRRIDCYGVTFTVMMFDFTTPSAGLSETGWETWMLLLP